MRRRIVRNTLGAGVVIVTVGAACAVTAGPAQAESVDVTLTDAVAALPVEDEIRDGYDRDLFPHWSDADGDGCSTRDEVLISEAVEAPDVGSGCDLSGGKWFSYFDGAEWTNPSDLDIDHFVPLAESWDSGSRDWTTDDRERFANDLEEERGLIAVTDNVNQEKGDQDPAEWMPSVGEVHCQYVQEWTVVKSRWRLSVDAAEKDALTQIAGGCENVTLSFEYAI